MNQNQHLQFEHFLVAPAENLNQVADGSMDVVVCTLVLCSVQNVEDVLKEVKRVLRPGGAFYFLEHVAADHSSWSYFWQQVLYPTWKLVFNGCCLTREPWKEIEKAKFSEPICLPFAHFHVNIENRTQCFITGWGSISEKGESARILQEAEVYIIPSDICNGFDWYAGMITANMLCAGDESGGIDSCQGDSGGPLACYDPSASKYYLTGITSFGFGCGRPRLPGIYVRMSQYDRWVNTHILLGSKSTAMSIALALNFLCVGWILLETA
ncbi:transmembrane protease serine 12 [Alligator mississippiensis]|uniref:Transmembrane protease serine 12 n=1 Tax=Alligator mississippiensis TaxID=8496 RepID=A0A151MRP2_ALLMI|nr:transmembrane protease serine 12 [Alligator mississippiensis]